jgi:hypothetical protein
MANFSVNIGTIDMPMISKPTRFTSLNKRVTARENFPRKCFVSVAKSCRFADLFDGIAKQIEKCQQT